MSKLCVRSFSISVDGYGAGPNQGPGNPLGEMGPELMQWFFPTRARRRMHGGGEGQGETGVDILTERLVLQPMTPAFLEASLGESSRRDAADLLGLSIPDAWFEQVVLLLAGEPLRTLLDEGPASSPSPVSERRPAGGCDTSRVAERPWRIAPILGVGNVRQTAECYRDVLGFTLDPVDGIVARNGVRLLAIAREERYLLRRFGAEYEAYCRSVRRWL